MTSKKSYQKKNETNKKILYERKKVKKERCGQLNNLIIKSGILIWSSQLVSVSSPIEEDHSFTHEGSLGKQ